METKHDDAKKAQEEFCSQRGWPHFAPHSGICYFCKKDIYSDTSKTLAHNGKTHITGCPHCSRSYCD